jgi:hypothetical protein
MPEMKVHKSGGIVFHPTKEEREIRELKRTLRQEIEDVQKLKLELLHMKEGLQGGEK